MSTPKHESYMQQCIHLAQKGLGLVAPNPMVGCIIVYEDKIIGSGYHQLYGQAHAEVNAINSVTEKALLKSSTLYVNLEPCSHFGKTPPCADLIIQHQIPHVVIGCTDPNPLVSGSGIKKLQQTGVEITTGVLEKECAALNKRFITWHLKKRPYIILKWAQTSDGYIDANRNLENPGKALSISNTYSKKVLHQWRSQEQGIMVGTTTVLMDNPRLTVRETDGINPIRITIDHWLRIPGHFHILNTESKNIVFNSMKNEMVSTTEYVKIDFSKNILQQILEVLHQKNIQSVIVEGGEILLNSFIKENLWDEARVFVSPQKLLSGVKAPVFLHQVHSVENIRGDELLTYHNAKPL